MIEKMTHVAVVADAARRDDVLGWLYQARAFHLLPLAASDSGGGDDSGDARRWTQTFRPCESDTLGALDASVSALASVVAFCHEHRSVQPSFLDQLFPLKLVASRRELADAVAACDPQPLADELARRRATLDAARETGQRIQHRVEQLRQFAFLGDALPGLPRAQHVLFRLVAVQGEAEKGFLADQRVAGADAAVVADAVHIDGPVTYYALVAAPADRAALDGLVEDHGLAVQPLPDVDRPAGVELAALENELAEAERVRQHEEAGARQFADVWDRKASLALGHWESERARALREPQTVRGEHVFAARGYVRTTALESLQADLAQRFGSAAEILPCDAPKDEQPPTSLRWNKLIRPASLITKMYGLPAYRGLDATPFVATVFFLFVGICLGDAVYGVMLIAAMLWLKRRYREQKGLQDFFNLFVYSGISAMVFGVLTGSFFADLLHYLAAVSPVFKPLNDLRNSLAQIDPIAQAQTALVIAVGCGIVTQFYGMALRVYKDTRNGDYMAAFSDGLLWMTFLGGLIVAGLAATDTLPAAALRPATWVAGLSAVGLVLTQGRDHKNWGLRLLVGLVSLYGIVGAYGLSGFLGDVISYARLMALALTSAALGSTFNMLADLARSAGVVGVVLAVLIVIFGHLMNFGLSVLSAFVHSARLMMLEFFGRFYDGGGYAFDPHGFAHPTVEIDEDASTAHSQDKAA